MKNIDTTWFQILFLIDLLKGYYNRISIILKMKGADHSFVPVSSSLEAEMPSGKVISGANLNVENRLGGGADTSAAETESGGDQSTL